MNYEEFIKEYNDEFEKIKLIYFSSQDESMVYTMISDNPRDYIDIASKCTNLSSIRLDGIQSSEYYNSIIEFVKNCNDNVAISNSLIGKATKEEFLRGEEKINNIIKEINPEWTTKQKVAFVHYKMGELISYAPDFCFSGKYVNSKAANDSRNIWKAVDSGVSVCNGVTAIQRNILSRMGIKTKELSSGTHSFMLVETEEGNIITDATWDLASTLFEARPMYFGRTYEQLQQIDGPLSKAHRLKEVPENIIEIPEEELREIYHSIGLTTEDRKFKMPILSKVEEIDSQRFDTEKDKVNSLFKMFTEDFSKQATHLTESRAMLENCMTTLGIDRKNITTKFVYSKEDKDCEKPYLSIHINGEEMNNTIAVLNTQEMKFENMQIKEFDEAYKQHDEDTREPFWKKYLQREENERDTVKGREEE